VQSRVIISHYSVFTTVYFEKKKISTTRPQVVLAGFIVIPQKSLMEHSVKKGDSCRKLSRIMTDRMKTTSRAFRVLWI